MNKARRSKIDALVAKLHELATEVEGLRDDEQAYRDAMPDSLSDGEKSQKAAMAVDELEEAYGALLEAIEHLEEAKG